MNDKPPSAATSHLSPQPSSDLSVSSSMFDPHRVNLEGNNFNDSDEEWAQDIPEEIG